MIKTLSDKILKFICWLSPAGFLAVYLLIHFLSDKWWFSTFLLFIPWYYSLTPIFLLAAAVMFQGRYILLLPLAVSLFLVLFPISGFNLPLNAPSAEGKSIRVLTYNIHGGAVDKKRLLKMMKDYRIDLAALQECPEDLDIPLPAGYFIFKKGGMAILSRFPVMSAETLPVLFPGDKWPYTALIKAEVKTAEGKIDFCSIHLPSPRNGIQELTDKFTVISPERKGALIKQSAHRNYAASKVKYYLDSLSNPRVAAGDFNTPVQGRLYQNFFSEYSNAFSLTGTGFGFTQRASFRGIKLSARIDHILADKRLLFMTSEIVEDIGSDHLPLVADLAFKSSSGN